MSSNIKQKNKDMGFRPPEGLPEGVTVRSFGLQPKTFNPDDLTVDAVLATENPTRVWDWDRFEVVNEVLRMEGLRLPKQLPLLDSHRRESITDQLGSTVNLRTDEGMLVGMRRFSRGNEKAELAARMVEQGHLTDGSIGYLPRTAEWVDKGEKREVLGREYEGPVKVVTEWDLLEDSLTPIGADGDAKVRDRLNDMISRKNKEDAMSDNDNAPVDSQAQPAAAPAAPADPAVDEAKLREEVRAQVLADERKRCVAIRQLARLAQNEELGEKLVDDGVTEEEARNALYKAAEERGLFGGSSAQAPSSDDEDSSSELDSIPDDVLVRSLCKPPLFKS